MNNLRSKPRERTLDPPGISVFLGGAPREAAANVREAFSGATRLLRAAQVVAMAPLHAIRASGFDVVAAPTRHFANHARLVHPDGEEGFTDEALSRLALVFHDLDTAD